MSSKPSSTFKRTIKRKNQPCTSTQEIIIPSEECQAFQSSISNYISRQKTKQNILLTRSKSASDSFAKLSKKVNYLTNHVTQILTTLYIKRHSLALGIDAFHLICDECIDILKNIIQSIQRQQFSSSNNNSSNNIPKHVSSSFCETFKQLLTHIFTQYIHLRDGFVLLTSGECRHQADSKLALSTSSSKAKKNNNTNSNNKYPSRLNQSKIRDDGYTQLYSSKNGYSGYGWDEFFNEEVGVKSLLFNALYLITHQIGQMKAQHQEELDNLLFLTKDKMSRKSMHLRDKIKDKIMNTTGGELLEMTFDKHDTIIKDLQRKLESHRIHLLNKIRQTCSVWDATTQINIQMNIEDKFERLTVKNIKGIGLDVWSIQRQGDMFKGNNSGALPSNVSLEDWLSIMALPLELKELNYGRKSIERSQNNSHDKDKMSKTCVHGDNSSVPHAKKKRLVVIDSDDDDDDDDTQNDNAHSSKNSKNSNKHNNQSEHNISCFKVTTKESKQNQNAESTLSVYNIKKQLGVNLNELEQSRLELEEEEKESKKAAYVEEMGEHYSSSTSHVLNDHKHNVSVYSDEIAELDYQIVDEEERVQLLRSVCKRKNNRDEEAWDARESFRFALMTLGNLLLEKNALIVTEKSESYSILKMAQVYFEEAIIIVRQLDKMNEEDNNNSINDTDVKFRCRALLLCRGRAYTNLGKTFFEQSEALSRGIMNELVINTEKKSKLSAALKFLKNAEQDSRSLRAQAVSIASVDQRGFVHKLEADTLESLSCRYKGYVFWRWLKEQNSIDALKKAIGNDDLASLASYSHNGERNEDVIQAKVNLLLEKYHGATSLILIATSALEQQIRGSIESSCSDDDDDSRFKVICEGYDSATNISRLLNQISTCTEYPYSFEDIMAEYDIARNDIIEEMKSKFIHRWRERKGHKSSSKLTNFQSSHIPIKLLRRNDIFRNESTRFDTVVSETVIIGQNKSKLKKQNRAIATAKTNDDTFDDFDLNTNSGANDALSHFEEDEEPEPRNFRKWGDQALQELGLDSDTYPGCVPVKPPEMIECLSAS